MKYEPSSLLFLLEPTMILSIKQTMIIQEGSHAGLLTYR